jgi:hypothetical protein
MDAVDQPSLPDASWDGQRVTRSDVQIAWTP